MPITIQNIPATELIRDSRAKINSNFDACKAGFDALETAFLNHGHVISAITGLQGALDGKAPTSHGHAIAEVATLQASLDAKANANADVVADAGTARVLTLSDLNKVIRFTAATAITVTVPGDGTMATPQGGGFAFIQAGAGQITLVTTSGSVINGNGGIFKSRTQGSMFGIIKTPIANNYDITGDLATS